MTYHQPVLLDEVLNFFQPKEGLAILDCTLGNGGHTLEFLKKGATVFGLDDDPINLEITTKRIKKEKLDKRFHPISGNFSNLNQIYSRHIKIPLDALFADLGLSRNQQVSTKRGFSYSDTDSLDMRLNPKKQKLTAEEIINTWDKFQLYNLFTKYSQEKLAKPLVFEIIQARQKKPITTGIQLATIIENYYQKKHYRSKINPSTKIFMSLRIAVNNEFNNLQKLLNTSQKIVRKDGKIGIITFHSGEDRIVKNFLQKNKIKSNKFSASYSEIKKNPLSRSAMFRCFINHDTK